jgi:hypothetical protein
MSLDRSIFKKAADHLREFGWRKGDYGSQGQPCCALGALAVAACTSPYRLDCGVPEYDALQAAARAKGAYGIINYNDEVAASADDVIALFDELAAESSTETV